MRPVAMTDLDQLVELAGMTSFGLTSLPKDRELLRKKITAAQRSFQDQPDGPGGETYLFVMEDVDTGVVAGTSNVASKVGGFEPFYAYRLETTVHESAMLNVRKEVRTLHLVTEHNGPCEIGSLFLRPSYRMAGHGRLLSLSRFLFMAEFTRVFDPTVIAEMRGVIDERGHSDFWDALGRHFFDIDFPDADYLSVVNKRFIADLMPTHPIYVNLLPRDAQAVIGQVHDRTRPALKLLESEGFSFSGMVDIFEAGPIVRCPLKDIRTVRQSVKSSVTELSDQEPQGEPLLISNTRWDDFRACIGAVDVSNPQSVRISAAVAAALRVQPGQPVRFAGLRALK